MAALNERRDPTPRLDNGDRLAGWAPTIGLVAIVTAARLVYLAWLCPYALIEDEAHYWEWSRHLDWSYYSKGPGIAWLIALAARLLGTSEFGIRAPAAVLGGIAALAAAGLARDATDSKRAGFFAAACMMLAPIFQFNALIMTIDMPYLAAWLAACWLCWKGMKGGANGGPPRVGLGVWGSAGLVFAVGFLFKYTTLLLLPGLALFAWMERRERRGYRPVRGMLAGLSVAAVGLLPVVIWNVRNGWPTVAHLLGHLGLAAGDVPAKDRAGTAWHYDPAWTLEFVGIQAVILGPVMYLGLVGLVWGLKSADAGLRRGMRYLLCCGLPIVVFYLAVTLFTEVEGNWASAGYVTLIPAAGWAAATAHAGKDAARRLWRWSVVVGVVVGLTALRLDWLAVSSPAVWAEGGLRAAGLKKDDRPLVPAGRLMAAPALAGDAAALAADLRDRTGLEPFYVAEHYGRASLLAFYLPGRPVVYCSSSLMDEGRRTQYDYWPETDLADLAVLGGRPAVCLGKTRDRWEAAFARVEEAGRLAHEPKRDRLVFLGFDYRGFGYRGSKPGADAR